MTIVQFLQARLDEDEAFAREAQAGPWHIGNAVDPTQPCNIHTFPSVRLVADVPGWLDAEHIARHDPARVLREVEAKRQIVGLHKIIDFGPHPLDGRPTPECQRCGTAAPCNTLRFAAAVYADHPDYDEAWRV